MKRYITFFMVTLVAAMLFAGQAMASGLVVLVDPQSSEAQEIAELGYLPVGTMDELVAFLGDTPCIVGLAYSGYRLADLDWFAEQLDRGTTLITFGWESDSFVEGDMTEPEPVPDAISVGYIYGNTPISYNLDSPDELELEVEWACFYFDDDPWADLGFDLEDLDLILEEIMAEAAPVLAFLDTFLQPEWEYKVVSLVEWANNDLESLLNRLGSDGWELVQITGEGLVMKRRALDAERLVEMIFHLAQEMMETAAEGGLWP